MQGQSAQEEKKVLIGSYTAGVEQKSLYLYNPNDKSAQPLLETINPSYAIHHHGYIYVASQQEKGEIITLNSSYEVISRVSTLGKDPCHISINKQGQQMVVCNYNSGSVAIFTLEQHKPIKIKCFITHEGNSNNQERQSSSHPHSSLFTPNNEILFIADLGTDIIYYYSVGEHIQAQKDKSLKLSGAGPRTVCHGKEGSKTLFLSCQLDNTIRMLSYENGPIEQIVAYRTSNNPDNLLSEIQYFKGELYLTMRGDDMMIIFKDEGDKLTQKLGFKTGSYPRHFAITDYNVMYIACQKENKVYRYMFKDDKILQIGQLNLQAPSCITIIQ